MSGPTRFRYGINNLPGSHPLKNLPVPFGAYSHVYQNDFDAYAAADWTVGVVGAGTAALVVGNGGVIALATTGANGDSVHLLKNPASYQVNQGFQAAFFTRVRVDSVATQTTWQLGLQAGGTAFAPTDGVYFTKAAANNFLTGNIRKAGVSTTVQVPIAGNQVVLGNTYMTVAWWYDPRNAVVQFFAGNSTDADFFNSISSYYTGLASIADLTNMPFATDLALGMGMQTNSANIRTMNIDHVTAWADLAR